jgi:phage terminase small subunit
MPDAPPKPPSALKSAGKSLWNAVLGDLPSHLELDARELEVLGTACAQADLNAALERAIKRDGVTVAGARGQRRLNAAVPELRQGRAALARLLEALDLGPGEGFSEAPTSRRARRAAEGRWGKRRAS